MVSPSPFVTNGPSFKIKKTDATNFYGIDFEGCGDLIDRVWYWRLPMKQLPTRTMAKVLGRLAVLEISFRLKSRASTHLPLMHNPRPLVFSDPREVILYELKPRDVVLCHDMGPVTHPDLYHPTVKPTYETAFDKIRKAKPLLVFVSECSLKTFVTLYGDDYPSMKLIYPALRLGIHSGPEEPIAAAPQRFLLTVGSVGSRKNHLFLVRLGSAGIKLFFPGRLGSQGRIVSWPHIGNTTWRREIERGEDDIDAEFQSRESERESLPA